MARKATALFEEFPAMRGIARRLMIEWRARESGLPNESGERLNFVLREPELRHLGARTKFGGVANPVRNPFLAQLLTGFLQVRANFFDFLQKVVTLLLERLGTRVHPANLNREVSCLAVQPVGGSVVGRRISLLLQTRDQEQILRFRLRQLQNLLARIDELFVLIIETLEPVASDAAALAIKLFPLVEHSRMLGDHVRGMALLATRVVIFGVIQRPEPMLVASMPAPDRVNCTAVPAVARRTTEFLKRMQGKEFLVRMT